MYAFGILMNEVMTSAEPFRGVVDPEIMSRMVTQDGEYRPRLYNGPVDRMIPIILDSWDVDPTLRGDFFRLRFLISRCMTVLESESHACSVDPVYVEDVFLASDISGFYTGYMIGCFKHGYGILRTLNRLVYEGNWTKNQLHGYGKRTGPDYCYEGEYAYFCKDGHGVIIYADGHEYDGEWKDNSIEGKGRMKYQDGSVYEGSWKRDVRAGYGVMTYANGSTYAGEWRNDRTVESIDFARMYRTDSPPMNQRLL